ncbi:glutamate dehydrogenase [Mycolicibacterium mageritense DSM 44476 = CIP 104973]|uniref:Glutamate dehydrogenase n=1 Tax=Mycolicibacterium mageritense TaxID=53462 RepID=A0AAI8TRZ6_MYCME|nr:Glu/Leu/Phe/Val dehydrogenase dimerization domain-containing protein [Mycolicibacterium mageritense]TXI63313.1 MAG: glutamate dehydrogenase [Mycolicibacterium mageritense]BBX33724.1 glutamate dehydrogenase [Mycolicibacterium mageritense]BDY27751.1 Glutamate dehydrogenase [Mycolicibacterium mageritense]CDO22150.1 glutamate dehydrogenase [Mycolicibacterium mageritense DSM 44476 = CIP 104973]
MADSYFEVTWTDPVTDAKGYLVIDRLVRGISSGGLRMRAGCTLAEVRGLAQGMTLKEAMHYEEGARYVPLGGAKGGIDFDPYSADAEQVLFRYLAAMKPLIEQRWTMGEDFGVRQDAVDRGIAEIGLDSSVQAAYQVIEDRAGADARMKTAFSAVVDGVKLDELVGGYGVAQAGLAAMERLGMPAADTRAVVQGFGSMGGATARYLARAGVKIVGIVDVHGVVANPDGLDVERLLLTRDAAGGMDRNQLREGDAQLPANQWLAIPADVLVPAAMSYCIDSSNQADVQAKLIVEAANMPVLPDAEATLAARGVTVSPDFVANSATNAWWWWVFFGDIDGSPQQSFAKISDRIRALSHNMFDYAEANAVTPREAALAVAAQRLALIDERFPIL